MSIPHYKISYSQNFEDLILAGILKSVNEGFYVDVGANHPEQDSVTKILYDKGWTGINIEPNDSLHVALCAQRPADINLKIGLSSQPGQLVFRSYEALDGLSTFSADSKVNIEKVRPTTPFADLLVEVRRLSDVLREHRPSGEIHFLKIDVEGMEFEVLLGNQWDQFRPWVLCIERPHLERNQNRALAAAMSTFLDSWHYAAVFFDGINDYFVANEHAGIWDGFSYADDVVLNGVVVNHIFIKCIDDLRTKNQPR